MTKTLFSIAGVRVIVDPSVPECMALVASEKEARALECAIKEQINAHPSDDLYADVTDWRLDKIIHIKSNLFSDSLCDDFEELTSDIDTDSPPYEQIFQRMPELHGLYGGRHLSPDRDEILEFFHEHPQYQNGFFVQIATTLPEYFDESSWSSSWGYYTTRWIHVDTIHDAELAARDLSRQVHARAKQNFLTQLQLQKGNESC